MYHFQKTIFLFDVDATLTPARQPIQSDMIEFLKNLKQKYDIGAVGGSDLNKLKEQLQDSISIFNYVFTENGLVGFKDGIKFHEKVYKYKFHFIRGKLYFLYIQQYFPINHLKLNFLENK